MSIRSLSRSAILFGAIIFSITMSAGDAPPPAERSQAPAHRPIVPIPRVTLPKPIPDPAGPLTLERLDAAELSGVVDRAFRRELMKQSGKLSATPSSTKAARSRAVTTPSAQEGPSTTLNAYVGGTSKATDDTLQDTEPSVVALNIAGTDYTISAGIKYTNVGGTITARINVSSTTTLANGSYTRQELPMPRDAQGNLVYHHSGDPYLAANVYSNGVWGKRVYCVGLLFNPTTDQAPSAIGVWRSDDGGLSWSGPSIVASMGGGGYFIDKPALAVSYYTNTLGHLYVTYVVRDTATPTGSALWVAGSNDGGSTFSSSVVSYDNLQGPQVVVNANNGEVYAVWVNYTYNDIRFAASSANTTSLSFGAHESAAGGNLLFGALNRIINGGVRAPTLPAAKYVWQANRLAVVYHAGSASNTEVYYTYRPCSSNCNYWGWEQPIRLNDSTTGDQFMPALDYIGSDLVVPFYDRRNDPNNLQYHQYYAFIQSNGTAIQVNEQVSTFTSNPAHHTSSTGDANFIGDYQDCWTWTYAGGVTRAISSWIGIQNSSSIGDVHLSQIIP